MSDCTNPATFALRGSKGGVHWEEYLVDERGADPPVHGLVIPMCEEHDQLKIMRDTYERSPLHDDVTAILDQLDTDLLRDAHDSVTG